MSFRDIGPFLHAMAENTADRIRSVCLGRAVLLGGLPIPVLRSIIGDDAGALEAATAAQRVAAVESAGESGRRDRYLPLPPQRAGFGSFNDWANAARPQGWSWVEVLAAGGSVSAHQLARGDHSGLRGGHLRARDSGGISGQP